MWGSQRSFWLLAMLAVFVPAKLASAQGETANSTLSGIAIVPVPVRPPLESAAARFTDTAVYLIGSASATSFGLSARATIHPQIELTGKEQAVAYLYASCDDAPPAGSAGVPVATANLGTLKAGRSPQTIIATVTATSLLPMANVTCAKVAVVCKECDEPGTLLSQDVTRKLPLVRESTAPLDAWRCHYCADRPAGQQELRRFLSRQGHAHGGSDRQGKAGRQSL